MKMLEFVRMYWTQIAFLIGIVVSIIKLYFLYRKSTLCSLRNDILEIWDKCKTTETISRYQLEAYTLSRDLYFKYHGDGFVHALDNKIMNFKIID